MPANTRPIRRRRLLAAAAAWPAAAAAQSTSQPAPSVKALARGAELLLGQCATLQGAMGQQVRQFNAGAQLVFDEINAVGGVQGHRLRLVTIDDREDAALAQAAALKLLHEQQVFALFGCVGTATTTAIEPLLRDAGSLSFAGWAVADSARLRSRGVGYFLRAGYGRECEALAQQFATVGIQRIGMAHLADAGGNEALQGAVQALAAQRMEMVVSAAVNREGDNVSETAKKLMSVQPPAVLLYLPGAAAADLIAAVGQLGGRPAFYGLSVVDGQTVIQRLNDGAAGLAIAQVMPYPWHPADPHLVKYRRLATAARVPVGYASVEGYVAARVLVEALQRCGGEFHAARLHAVLRRMQWRYAGLSIDFGAGDGTGSRFVDLVQIAPGGRYVR